MQWVYSIAGLVSVAVGTLMILTAFAFATLVDPDLPDAARNAAIFRRFTINGGAPLSIGVVLILAGLWLAFSRPKAP